MPIRFEISGAVAHVVLNRPEKRNALDESMISELHGAIGKAAGAVDVRVVVLAGEGPDFCAGMDLAAMAEPAKGDAIEFLDAAECLADLYRAFRDLPKPLVALVRGRALGGGCGLAIACDAVLASESARFGFPEVNIGFVPAIVMSLLRRSVGEKRAFDLLASGEPVTAREALDLGMITKVYPDSDFEASAQTYVETLAAKSGSAMGLTKKLFYAVDGLSFDAALTAGAHVNAIARTTADARQGFEKFSKRKR